MKQTNKSHKQRHRSKGQIDKEDGGRIDDFKSRGKHKQEERKVDRRNHNKQLRIAKREEVTQNKRALGKAPHVVVVVGLCGDVTSAARVCNTLAPDAIFNEAADPRLAKMGTVWNPALKRWVGIVGAPEDDVCGVLDLARVADTVLFAVSASAPVTDFGMLCQTTIRALGAASVTYIVTDLDEQPMKRRNDLKKAATHSAHAEFPEAKVHSLDSTKDVSTTLWNVVNAKHRTLPWRDGHPYLLAQDISFVPSVDNPDMGTLLVTGYTRGQSFNVNDLVHLPALGACKVSGVTAEQDPAIAPHADGRRPGKGTVIAAPHPERQQDLDSVVPLDPLAGEQTWPTDEEIAAAQAENEDGAGPVAEVPTAAAGQRLVRVPKGTSSYQAQWIVDAVDFDAGDAGGTAAEDDGDAMAMADATMDADSDDGGAAAATSGAHVTFAEDPDEEFEVIDATDTAAERAREYDAEMDADEEQGALDAAAEDKEFPDEVDTPQHMLAKVRFQKYRGLQSFRHSRWDPREELPEDYARIFQFQSFSRTRKRVLAKNSGDGTPGWVAPGRYVTLHVESISAEYFAAIPDGQVFIGFGLLEHENRKSVLNFKLQMHSTYSTPIRSKEKLIFYTGIRRFTSCPIFSQHSVGDKHKFERFFQAGEVCVASTFAPIHYPPSPVLVFRNTEEGVRLVATGSLLSVNPDRMVIKRIRLSAHPFKINKRTATLRYMFFTPEDIHWFKSVELTTKYGRKGHIKESLGTHGHMKCVFDGPINAQDTVLMNLFKRVYPKWTYEELGFA